MGDGGPEDHAQYKDGGVPVSLAGQEELAAGTSAGQAEGQARQRHSQEIPEVHRVGDGLTFESRFELSQDEVDDEGGNDEGHESRQEVHLPEKDEVTNGAHGAETAPLGQKSDQKTHDQRHRKWRMHRARPLDTVEENPAFRLAGDLRKNKHEKEQPHHEEGQHQSRRMVRLLGPSEIVSPFQEKGADPDADDQAQQAKDGVAVAAGETQRRPPGAPQKHQRPDHGKDTEDKPDDRRGAQTGTVFLEQVGGHQRPEDKTDDFGANVLHHIGPVKAEGAGDVPFEAGHADPHVAGIPHFCKSGAKIPIMIPVPMMPNALQTCF